MKNGLIKDERVQTDKGPERPFKVRLALSLLWLSLGISVTRVLVAWWLFGAPVPPGTFIAAFLIWIATLFHFRGSVWMIHGDVLIAPIAASLYYMIAKGKNWARITLLIWIILETLAGILPLVMFMRSPVIGQAPSTITDDLIEKSPLILQSVLQIVAVALLFARASSDWFKLMKQENRRQRTKVDGMVTLAIGLSGALSVIAASLQLSFA